MITFEKTMLDEVHRLAVAEYPHECCGVIIGRPGGHGEDILYPCVNIQNKLHAADPVAHPRDARTAFNIDPRELLKIENDIRDKGMAIKTFYHSHPDHDAYFSQEDTKRALSDWGDPWYPDASHLVVSVYNGQIKDQALFAWNAEKKVFEKQKDLNL